MHDNSFNGDFYLIIATVIPVILLGITVTGFAKSWVGILARALIKSRRLTAPSFVLGLFLCTAPFLLGINSERLCINALHARENLSEGTDGFMVFVVTTLMVIAVSGSIDAILKDAIGFIDKPGTKD